jgi:hypothetical protein
MNGVVFQCSACRALGTAYEVSVGDDGTSVGLACASCSATTWLPVAAAGQVRAEARPATTAPRALPPALAPPLPPTAATPAVASATAGAASDADDDGSTPPVLAPPVSTSTLPTPAAEAAVEAADEAAAVKPTALASPAETGAVTRPTPTTTTTTTTGLDDDARARILERWSKLGSVSIEQRPLAARLERLVRGPWSNEAEHKSLLKAASLADELAFVGSRYRAVLDVVRDEPQARAAQQELLTLAMLTMKGGRDLGDASEPRGKSKAYVALVTIAALGFIAAFGFFMHRMIESFRVLGDLG